MESKKDKLMDSERVVSFECDATSKTILPLVETGDGESWGGYYVLVCHKQLDSLIGDLMQMCELTGDTEQRKALKSEIKHRSRRWLDDLYYDSGYESLVGLRDGYKALKIK